MTTTLRQPEQNQSNRSGRRLNEQNPAADGGRAIDAGNDHAKQEEHLDLEGETGTACTSPHTIPAARKPL